MPELEDLLVGSDDEETEVETPEPKQDNKTIRELRAALKEQKKAREAAEARVAEYEPFREKAESYELKAMGLTEKQAAVFRKSYGEITEENLNEFKRDVLGLEVEAPSEEPEPAPQPTFKPLGSTGSGQVKVSYTVAEWNELRLTDPVKADKVLREGRIERQRVSPGGPAF